MLAAKLYSSAFKGLLQSSMRAIGDHAVIAGSDQVMVGAVTFQPEVFVPPKTSTSTSTMHTFGGRSDFVWFCLVLGCVAFPGAAAVVLLLMKEVCKSEDPA